ncbi:hypothetical protein TKK_0010357 [Trichogramma kaykai]|uniref:Ribosomal RNA processing protein 1 homolog n=1 Tax=Trichogramma kaykai TaxID=54128 RepID=A0ABD2WX62_9HYME
MSVVQIKSAKLKKRPFKGKKVKKTRALNNGTHVKENKNPAPKVSQAPKNENLFMVEAKFVRSLANSDKKVRDKVIKNLKKWLTLRSQSSCVFSEEDFLRLWKGLFYCMWMSDKMLIQEELAETISKLVFCFESFDTALLYTKCAFKTLAKEWFGIDNYRIDKFQMLVRRIVRQTFVLCKNYSWDKPCVVAIAKIFQELLMDPKTSLGLNLHITEIFMEELAKIGEEKIPKNIVKEFIRPYTIHLACSKDRRIVNNIVKNIFRYLIFQSDVGIDYTEKFEAWRNAGFPCKNINDMQKIEVSDDEDQDDENQIDETNEDCSTSVEKPLDPRAGRVDVEIPQILFNPAGIVKILEKYKFHKDSTTQTRKVVTKLIADFSKLTKGDMPIGIKEVPALETTRYDTQKAAEDLVEFKNKLESDTSKAYKKQLSLKRKAERELELESSQPQKQPKQQQQEQVEELDVSQTSKKMLKKQDKLLKKQAKNGLVSDSSKASKKQILLEKQAKNEPKTDSSKVPKKQVLLENQAENELESDSPKSSKKKVLLTKEAKNVDELNSSVKPKKPALLKKQAKNIEDSTSLSTSAELSTSETTPADSVIKKLKGKNKNKNMGSVTTTPIAMKKSLSSKLNTHVTTPVVTPNTKVFDTSSAKKRVRIMLEHNKEQHTSEYFRQLRLSPAIPFDGNKKPKAGVLKPSPLPSPIYPFTKEMYKRKIFL